MLDQLLKGALQGMSGGSNQGASSPLLQVVASMLGNNSSVGGLAGLVQQFSQAGLGDHINSWISTGQNLPVSGDQLSQVFGHEEMQHMANKAGMDSGAFGGALSQLLPQVIDQLTPHGQVPSGGLGDAIGMLTKMMGR